MNKLLSDIKKICLAAPLLTLSGVGYFAAKTPNLLRFQEPAND